MLGMLFSFFACTAIQAIEENQGWPVDWYMARTCPLSIDFDNNGSMDVVVGTATRDSLGAWNSDGRPLDGWPIGLPFDPSSEVAGGDIDNDGRIEVVVAVWDTSSIAFAIRSDGTQPEGWPFDLPAKATVAPALFDLDGDGKLETIISSTDTGSRDSGKGIRCGRLGIYSCRGELLEGWPFFIAQRLLETTPSVADIDLDGDFEIIFGTYEHYYFGPGWIHVYNHDGTPFTGAIDFIKLDDAICVTPVSLADIHGDMRPEIIGCDTKGLIHILDNGANYIPGWPQVQTQGRMSDMPVAIGAQDGPAEFLWGESEDAKSFIYDSEGNLLPDWPWYGIGMMRSQPIVGDLDGDESNSTPEAFLGGSRPYDVALDFYAEYPEGWPGYIDNQDFGTGALTDLDGDGDTDIMFLDYSGNLHAYDTPGIYRHDLIECPRYKYDNWHTGAYHKDIYREAESAREILGWKTVHDTTAWGHYCLRPITSADRYGAFKSDAPDTDLERVVSGRAAGGELVHPPVSHRVPYRLIFRTQVPVWKNYHVWARVRRPVHNEPEFTPSVTLDGSALRGGGAVEKSPGDWLWYELGEIAIKAGTHEFKIELRRCRRDIDRILFTTHNSLPLLNESPHGWETSCPGCGKFAGQHPTKAEVEEPENKSTTLFSRLGEFLAGLTN